MKQLQKAPSVLRGKLREQNYKKTRKCNSIIGQRSRILDWFKTNSQLSTIDARERLGILCPASRVLELRRIGYKIELTYQRQDDVSNTSHRVGVYFFGGQK